MSRAEPELPAINPADWSDVLTPRRSLFDLRLRELWAYRDLILLFIRRDFVAVYKQTILGPAWFLLQPLLTTIMFTIVFGWVARISTDRLPPFLFYLAGIVPWNYFADCVHKTANTFSQNASIFGKVYFPRLAVPISIVITSLIGFAIQFALFLVVLLYYLWTGAAVNPSWRIIVAPFLLLEMAILGLGVGCLVASLTTRYRDLAMAVSFGVQLWMYASAVVYPISAISPEMRRFMILNPMVPIIEAFRFSFLGAGVVELWQILLSFAISVVVCAAGLLLFHRVERTVMDTI